MAKNLAPDEIEHALRKIRKSYDDYIIQYTKSPRIRQQFEDRYYEALKANIRLDRFIMEEKRAIDEMIEREEQRLRAEQAERARKARTAKPRSGEGDFADRIMEELKQKIAHYPEIEVHADSNPEVRKLFGAIKRFDSQDWPEMNSLFRKVYPVFASGPRIALENKLFNFLPTSSGDVPPRLSRYETLLNQFPRNYRAIDSEEKNCILEVAFFLHDVNDELKGMLESPALNHKEKALVEKIKISVQSMINDFRLKDLKQQR
jgi:hypothetical protein